MIYYKPDMILVCKINTSLQPETIKFSYGLVKFLVFITYMWLNIKKYCWKNGFGLVVKLFLVQTVVADYAFPYQLKQFAAISAYLVHEWVEGDLLEL